MKPAAAAVDVVVEGHGYSIGNHGPGRCWLAGLGGMCPHPVLTGQDVCAVHTRFARTVPKSRLRLARAGVEVDEPSESMRRIYRIEDALAAGHGVIT